jgi:protein-disulfide isomerase
MSGNRSHLKPPVGPDDHIEGAADAAVTLLEYGDYQCPYCGDAYPIVKRVQKQLGTRLRFAFRNFPLAEAHPYATGAAQLAEAAALQGKFWQMHDMLYEHQDALDPDHLLGYARQLHLDMAKIEAALGSSAVTGRVRSDFTSGVRSGVNGTPSFFINGERFDGNWTDPDEFIGALEAAARGAS